MTRDELRIDLHLRAAMSAMYEFGVDVDRIYYWRALLKPLKLTEQLVVILHVIREFPFNKIDDFLDWNRCGTTRGSRSRKLWLRVKPYLRNVSQDVLGPFMP